MALKALGSRISRLPPLIKRADATEAERSKTRDRTEPWRAWYKTARWQKLRWQVLIRDGFQCRQCGYITSAKGALVCDHVVDHKGDEHLFWHGEMQTLCIECHGKKARTPNARRW